MVPNKAYCTTGLGDLEEHKICEQECDVTYRLFFACAIIQHDGFIAPGVNFKARSLVRNFHILPGDFRLYLNTIENHHKD